jgi:hypothetical protein
VGYPSPLSPRPHSSDHGLQVGLSRAADSVTPIAKVVLLFFLLFIALRHLIPTGILFYQGMEVGAVVSLGQLVLGWRRSGVQRSAWIKDAVISFLLIYAFLITVPTNADRAFTLKMLKRLAEAPSGLDREEITKFYTVDFVENGGLEKRLTEQTATGTVVERDRRYMLTTKGRVVNSVTNLTCSLFVCEKPPIPR